MFQVQQRKLFRTFKSQVDPLLYSLCQRADLGLPNEAPLQLQLCTHVGRGRWRQRRRRQRRRRRRLALRRRRVRIPSGAGPNELSVRTPEPPEPLPGWPHTESQQRPTRGFISLETASDHAISVDDQGEEEKKRGKTVLPYYESRGRSRYFIEPFPQNS